MSSVDFASAPLAPGSPLVPPVNKQLGQNPMLPTPQTNDVDAQYLLDEAALRKTLGTQYADILQQLGWVDEGGNFIPGSLSVQAGRQASSAQRSSDLAAEDVTNEAQRTRTFFSGRRPVDQARAQFPYQSQIAQLGVDLPMALGGLYEQAAGIRDQYTTQNNLLLAALAQRRAAAIAQQPAGPVNPPGPDQNPPSEPPTDTGPSPIPYTPGTESTIPGTQGSTQTTFTPQERAYIDAAPNVLRNVGSDAAQQGAALAPPPAEPVAGYGGDATAAQVDRNTTGYTDPFYTPDSYVPPTPTGFTPEPAAPEQSDSSIWLAAIPSDHPLLADLQAIAQPPPAPPVVGYGGGRNAGQVRRNNL